MPEYEPLFTPFEIGKLQIKNRFVMCPMTGSALIEKNVFSEKAADFYLKRAENGVGLIITAPSMVLDMWGRGFWLDEATDAFGKPLKSFTDKIHQHGTKIIMQLGVGLGRVVKMEPAKNIDGADIENIKTAVSQLPNVWEPEVTHREMTISEITDLRDHTIQSAVLAQQAGMDGVEIHAVHEGYLLDQFAIPFFNHRNDIYGGSLENRMRFACEIISGIRKKCGEDFIITVRFGVRSMMKGFNRGAVPGEVFEEKGRTARESIEVANMLIEAGCNGLNADNGTYDSWYWSHPPVYMHRSCNLDDVAFLKRNIRVPVICAGRMENHKEAAEAIRNDLIDGIGIARQFLADAQLVRKLWEGRPEDIRPCIACHNGCLGNLLNGKGLSCALDPSVMNEEEYQLTAAEYPKRVMIVGGGIGGMETARLAAQRGHEITLYEKADCLAGVFNAAAAPFFKEADRELIEWYKRQMEHENIQVRLNTEVTPEMIQKECPDVLIIATGASPRKLSIDGADEETVITAIDFLLREKPTGRNIVVIGGGLTGCEIAYEAACENNKVTVIEIADQIMANPGLCAANRNMLLELMGFHGVEIMTDTRVVRLEDGFLHVEKEGKEQLIPADKIVVSAGYTSDRSVLEEQLNNTETHLVGDAGEVGNLMTVIRSAWKAAASI